MEVHSGQGLGFLVDALLTPLLDAIVWNLGARFQPLALKGVEGCAEASELD